ncbi:50S ribosomal protein L21 [Candidatus Gracilibacteria bacterium]|nr:50S ribosomal protein L21 [Candidatus Gracilibacteria bacterium]
MFAIIEIGGKQYKVSEKDVIRTEKVDPSTAKVLLVSDGAKVHVGTPYLNSTVALEVLGTGQDDKVITFKMKAKKRYKRLKGHRQEYNDMRVGAITL